MEHFYHTIGEPWFQGMELYSRAVAHFPDGSHFVEVGSWMGRGAEDFNFGDDSALRPEQRPNPAATYEIIPFDDGKLVLAWVFFVVMRYRKLTRTLPNGPWVPVPYGEELDGWSPWSTTP